MVQKERMDLRKSLGTEQCVPPTFLNQPQLLLQLQAVEKQADWGATLPWPNPKFMEKPITDDHVKHQQQPFLCKKSLDQSGRLATILAWHLARQHTPVPTQQR